MALLYERHVDGALRLAKAVAGVEQAEELVYESFSRVWVTIANGAGPTDDFRTYLGAVIRHLNIELAEASRREQPASDKQWLLDTPIQPESERPDDIDSARAVRALQSLPDAWQTALMELDVKGRKVGAVAADMAVGSAMLSSTAYRAREGLRLAYLDQHIPAAGRRDCRWARDRLSKFVRDRLSPAATVKVQDHVDQCASCAAVHIELVQLNRRMRALVWPLVLAATADVTALSLAGQVGTASPRSSAADSAGMSTIVAGTVAAAAVVAATVLALTGSPSAPDLPTGGDMHSAPAPPGDSALPDDPLPDETEAEAAPTRPESTMHQERSPSSADPEAPGRPTDPAPDPDPHAVDLGDPQVIAASLPYHWLLVVPVLTDESWTNERFTISLEVAMSGVAGFVARLSSDWDCGPIQDGDPNGDPYFFDTVTCRFTHEPARSVTPFRLLIKAIDPSGVVTVNRADGIDDDTTKRSRPFNAG